MNRILGLGLDLVDVDRLALALERHGAAFVARVCRDGEAKPLAGRPLATHLAGLFAAKEAAMKALGTGWAAGIGFRQIEVERESGGAPRLRLHGAAEERARLLGVDRTHVSITHDGRSAVAVVILEGDPD